MLYYCVCFVYVYNSLAGAFAETFSVTNVQDETNTQVDACIQYTSAHALTKLVAPSEMVCM
jgi:uncharacterized membrane protein YgdD (TMEM256/DUF423 family)